MVESLSVRRPDWLQDLSGAPAALATALTKRCLVFVLARFSDPSVSGGSEYCHGDLVAAVRVLRQKLGLIVPAHCVPSAADLRELLANAEIVKSVDYENGKPFVNRFVVLDFSARYGLVFLISLGSAKRIDQNLEQPYLRWVREQSIRFRPTLVVSTDLDRQTRRAHAYGYLLDAWTSLGVWVQTKDDSMAASSPESLVLAIKAHASEQTARSITSHTKGDKALEHVDDRFEDGRAAVGTGGGIPPGFARLHLRDGVTQSRAYIYFDDPRVLPPAGDVATGRPAVAVVRDGKEREVSQVENIRWFLARLGKPSWSYERLAEGLAARAYSTDARRRGHHDPGWRLTPQWLREHPSAVTSIASTITEHLQLYRSGVMVVRSGGQEKQILGAIPEGGWATEEDWKRIARWESNPARQHQPSRLLSGIPMTIDGRRCSNQLHVSRSRRLHDTVYAPRRFTDTRSRPPAVEGFAIRHHALAGLYSQAIASAGDAALRLVDDGADDNADRDLIRVLEDAAGKVAALGVERDGVLRSMTDRHEDGSPVYTGAAARALNERHEHLTRSIDEIGEAKSHAAAELEQRRAGRRHARKSVNVQMLLSLVDSLRDPYNLTWYHLVRDVFADQTWHVTTNVDETFRLRVTGLLHLGDGSGAVVEHPFDVTIDVPAVDDCPHGDQCGVWSHVVDHPGDGGHAGDDRRGRPCRHPVTSEQRTAQRVAEAQERERRALEQREERKEATLRRRVDVALAYMSNGGTYGNVRAPRTEDGTHQAIATRLGLNPTGMLILRIRNPWMMRLVVNALINANTDEVARLCGCDPEHVVRARQVHKSDWTGRASWLNRRNRAVESLLAAASNDPVVRWGDVVGSAVPNRETMRASLRQTGWDDVFTAVHGVGLRLDVACCGHTSFAVPLIPEVEGLLCNHCQRDRSGLRWPVEEMNDSFSNLDAPVR